MTSPLHDSVGFRFRKYLDRLNHLETSLRDDPNQFDAWRHHIHVKVMTFIVHRCANGAVFDLTRLDELLRTPSQPYAQPHSPRRPDRTLADLLPILRRISDANRR